MRETKIDEMGIAPETCDRDRVVTLSDGTRITFADLPDPDTTRWVMRRKAAVVGAVRGGLISLTEACKRWSISVEEFSSWERLIDRHGVRGLRTTRLQQYREATREPAGNDSLGRHAKSNGANRIASGD